MREKKKKRPPDPENPSFAIRRPLRRPSQLILVCKSPFNLKGCYLPCLKLFGFWIHAILIASSRVAESYQWLLKARSLFMAVSSRSNIPTTSKEENGPHKSSITRGPHRCFTSHHRHHPRQRRHHPRQCRHHSRQRCRHPLSCGFCCSQLNEATTAGYHPGTPFSARFCTLISLTFPTVGLMYGIYFVLSMGVLEILFLIPSLCLMLRELMPGLSNFVPTYSLLATNLVDMATSWSNICSHQAPKCVVQTLRGLWPNFLQDSPDFVIILHQNHMITSDIKTFVLSFWDDDNQQDAKWNSKHGNLETMVFGGLFSLVRSNQIELLCLLCPSWMCWGDWWGMRRNSKKMNLVRLSLRSWSSTWLAFSYPKTPWWWRILGQYGTELKLVVGAAARRMGQFGLCAFPPLFSSLFSSFLALLAIEQHFSLIKGSKYSSINLPKYVIKNLTRYWTKNSSINRPKNLTKILSKTSSKFLWVSRSLFCFSLITGLTSWGSIVLCWFHWNFLLSTHWTILIYDIVSYMGGSSMLSCLHTWLCATMLIPNKYKVLSPIDRLIYWLSYQREKICNNHFFSFVIFHWIFMIIEKSNWGLCFYPLMRINCGASTRMLKEWDSIPWLLISMIQDQIQFLKSHLPYCEVKYFWDRTHRGIARNSLASSKTLIYSDNGSRCCKVLRGRTLKDISLYANKQVLTAYSAKFMFVRTFLGPAKAKRIYLVFDQVAPKWFNFL